MRGHSQRGDGVIHRDHIGHLVILFFSLSILLFSTRPDGGWIMLYGGWNVTLSATNIDTEREIHANSGQMRIHAGQKTSRTKFEVKRYTGQSTKWGLCLCCSEWKNERACSRSI